MDVVNLSLFPTPTLLHISHLYLFSLTMNPHLLVSGFDKLAWGMFWMYGITHS